MKMCALPDDAALERLMLRALGDARAAGLSGHAARLRAAQAVLAARPDLNPAQAMGLIVRVAP
ncbi:MAG TPA: hypothetical protein VL974_09030 [Magnetospirillum sp.]|jgi:hypothetical protein|nr:hypothetical protein [Magnetospirillum sp.]